MISSFKGKYSWLSNFYEVKIKLDGIEYPSVGHAYMSAKSDDMSWKSKCADRQAPAAKIKAESKTIQLKDNWEDIKVDIMKECLEQKFTQEPLKKWLLGTGIQLLYEGNTWGDDFWGVDSETFLGQNKLGLLLMDIRWRIRNNKLC